LATRKKGVSQMEHPPRKRLGFGQALPMRPGSLGQPFDRSEPRWWVHLDLNQGPAGYEPDALTAELWTRLAPCRSRRLYLTPRRAVLHRAPDRAGGSCLRG